MIGLIFRKLSGRPGGLVAGYHLQEWWIDRLSDQERGEIRAVVQKPFSSFQNIDSGNPDRMGDYTTFQFLASLCSWFEGPKNRHIGMKIARQASVETIEASCLLGLHFALGCMVSFWMRCRKESDEAESLALQYAEAMVGLEKEVAVAWRKEDKKNGGTGELVAHAGYEAACKIHAARGNATEAKRFAAEAKRRGWAGHWDRFTKVVIPK